MSGVPRMISTYIVAIDFKILYFDSFKIQIISPKIVPNITVNKLKSNVTLMPSI